MYIVILLEVNTSLYIQSSLEWYCQDDMHQHLWTSYKTITSCDTTFSIYFILQFMSHCCFQTLLWMISHRCNPCFLELNIQGLGHPGTTTMSCVAVTSCHITWHGISSDIILSYSEVWCMLIVATVFYMRSHSWCSSAMEVIRWQQHQWTLTLVTPSPWSPWSPWCTTQPLSGWHQMHLSMTFARFFPVQRLQ